MQNYDNKQALFCPHTNVEIKAGLPIYIIVITMLKQSFFTYLISMLI